MQLEPFKLEAGDRVRCVVPDELVGLFYGDEHVVFAADFHARTGKYRIWVDDGRRWFRAGRFKPVVRLKARTIYSGKALDGLIARSVAGFEAMPPEQQQAMQNAQRESWVRGQVGWD